jgi:hypothetical protein
MRNQRITSRKKIIQDLDGRLTDTDHIHADKMRAAEVNTNKNCRRQRNLQMECRLDLWILAKPLARRSEFKIKLINKVLKQRNFDLRLYLTCSLSITYSDKQANTHMRSQIVNTCTRTGAHIIVFNRLFWQPQSTGWLHTAHYRVCTCTHVTHRQTHTLNTWHAQLKSHSELPNFPPKHYKLWFLHAKVTGVILVRHFATSFTCTT